jgi:L-ascorbate metabolism protein UlaG (beta-lactamase superfamily)
MQIQHIRHATTLLWVYGKKILIDPLLAPKGTYTPVEKVINQHMNPLVDLPISLEKIVDCDAVLITHLHRDHFDKEAIEQLSKKLPILCQPQDTQSLLDLGFSNVNPIYDCLQWQGITFYRTGAKHGHGVLSIKMGPVSGFIIKAPDEPTLYVSGDTVWCELVNRTLKKFKPDVAICYCGSAQFAWGKPITMDKIDIQKIKSNAPHIKLFCIHMEAWNHCRLQREDLKNYAAVHHLTDVLIPDDGDLFRL